MASKDVHAALTIMNNALIHSTFLVGNTISLADASAVSAVAQLVLSASKLLQGCQFSKSFPHVTRWFLTCIHHPSVFVVLGDEPLKKFTSLSSAPAPLKAAVSGKTSSSTPAAVASSSSLSAAAGGSVKKFEYKNEVEGTPTLKFKYTLK